MAQPNTVSFGNFGGDPAAIQQQLEMQRQMQMADLLKKQSMEPLGPTEMVSGIAVKRSPLEGIAKLAQALVGNKLQSDSDAQAAQFAAGRQQKLAEALKVFSDPPSATAGTPAAGTTDANGQPTGTQTTGVQPASNPRASRLAAALTIQRINPELGNTLLKDQLTTPEAVKTMDLLGQDRETMGRAATAEAIKKGRMEAQPGNTIIDPITLRPLYTAPDFKSGVQGGYDAQGRPVMGAIPGSDVLAALDAQKAGAIASAQANWKPYVVKTDQGPIATTEGAFSRQVQGQSPQAPQQGANGWQIPANVQSQRDAQAGLLAVQEAGGLDGAVRNLAELDKALSKASGTQKGILQTERNILAAGIQQAQSASNQTPSAQQAPSQQPLPGIRLQDEGANASEIKRGEFFGNNYADLQKGAMAANTKIAALDRFSQLTNGVNTGKLTPRGTELAAYAASMGFNVDKNLGNKQAAEAISNQLALDLRNPSGGAGMPGAMSDSDRNYLKQMVPSLGDSPEAIQLKLEFAKRLAKRDQEIAELARNYKNGNLDNGFYTVVQQYANANPMFAASQRGPQANQQQPKQGQLSAAEQAELNALRARFRR